MTSIAVELIPITKQTPKIANECRWPRKTVDVDRRERERKATDENTDKNSGDEIERS